MKQWKTDRLWRDSVLDVLRELAPIRILVILLQLRHVLGNMLTKDMSTMNICVELFALAVVTRESLCSNSDNNNASVWRVHTSATAKLCRRLRHQHATAAPVLRC